MLLEFSPVRTLARATPGETDYYLVLVRCLQNGKLYIEKRVSARSIKSGHAVQEAQAFTRCSFPKIVRAYGASIEQQGLDYASIFMEHCPLGSLDDLIRRFAFYNTSLPEGILWKVLWDMSLALAYLQTGMDAAPDAYHGEPLPIGRARGWNCIVHRDVKPVNILFTNRDQETQYPTAVLANFGFSVTVEERLLPLPITMRPFATPEDPRFHENGDVYMLALTVHCMARTTTLPSDDYDGRKHHPAPGYSSILNRLLTRCLEENPSRRPDAGYLPFMVLREMQKLKLERKRLGISYEALPAWAFEQIDTDSGL
jgi:NIMA (never in mitosis gene a)-related kinase